MAEKKEMKINAEQAINAFRNEQAKMEALEKRIAAEQQILREINSAKEALEELKKEGQGAKTMVPLGSGIYVEAEIVNAKKIKKSLAGNVLIEDDAEKVMETLEKDAEKIEKNIAKLAQDRQIIALNLENLGKILNRFQQAQTTGKEK